MARASAATVSIVIYGLRRLGASLGLGLASHAEVRVTGYDSDPDLARLAQARGVVAKAHWNLLSAAEGADLVVLALPLDEQRNVLAAIAPELRAGCVVAALGPVLQPRLAHAAGALPADRHFVACHPVLNPAHLHTGEAGLEAASADLFAGGLWALAPAPNCAPEALKLVADVARLLDAFPYFVDPAEHDGLTAVTEGLPALMACALLRAAAASPGWSETRKVAERSFATATAALVEADSSALRANREHVLRYLEAALAELNALRDQLAAADGPALDEALSEAAARRADWLAQRRRGEWEAMDAPPAVATPSTGSMLGRMLVGGLFGKRDKPRDES